MDNPKLTDNFSAEQIARLREEFGKIETVNPDRLPEFHAFFDSMADHVLAQVAGAGIKWLSSLARNECMRRGVEIPLTVRLNNGREVLAKMSNGKPYEKTFANRTQAEKALAKAGPGWTIYHFGRPWYVGRI